MKFKKEEILLLVLALIIGLIGGYFIFSGEKTEHFVNSFIEDSHPKDNDNLIVNEAEEKTNQKEEENIKEIKVYITGSIKNPGVYTMKDGDRIIDLFQKAGGESIGANLEQINMASHIKDGEKIYIPNLSEGENNMEQNENNFYSSESKININFASKTELEELSGIGPSKATSIIKYRNENGNFNNIKELINVNGIGAATLSNIEDEVSVK